MNPLKTFFYSFKKSLIKTDYYADIVKASFGFSFKYLLFLLFILSFIKIFVFAGFYLKGRSFIQPEVNKAMKYAENFYPSELKLQVINGQLSTNVVEPYVIDLEKNTLETNRHLFIIDTKGSIEDYPNYNSYVLATKNAVVYPSKSSNGRIEQTSVFYFRDLKRNFVIDKNVYDSMLNIVRPYAPKVSSIVDLVVLSLSPLFLIFGSLFWTIGTMIGLVFLTFFIWIINLIFKKGYGYGALYKMGMHAATWPILFGFIFPKAYSLIFIVWMVIILFSQKNTAQKKSPTKKRV